MAGSTVTATPAPARRSAAAARRAGGRADSFGDVADGGASAPAATFRLPADLVEVERRRVEREVEVEVDVEVALGREVEDAGDLAVGIAVDVGGAADEVGAEVERGDQNGIATGVVE